MTLCETKEKAKPIYHTIILNLTEVIIHSVSILTLTVFLLFYCHHQVQGNNTHSHSVRAHTRTVLHHRCKRKYHFKLYSFILPLSVQIAPNLLFLKFQ